MERTLVEVAREFLEAYDEEKAAEEQLKELREKRRRLNDELIDRFQAEEVAGITVDGRNVSLARRIDPLHLVSAEATAEAFLQHPEYASLVKLGINYQTLGAVVREWYEGGGIPKEFRDLLDAHVSFRASVRHA